MAQPWVTWTNQEWLNNAKDYHSARLSADAWVALGEARQLQALTSARTFLAQWSGHKNFPLAVYEQALWLTTEDGTNSISDFSSVSVGTSSVSVSYGRSRKDGGPPVWMCPIAWALLKPSGGWDAGRVV